ncbi:MAG: hypothetical protein K2N88_09405, partial [Muribaculaceae bacterium]|nr:hypothetical protein [Muribaculaceae bacterium]
KDGNKYRLVEEGEELDWLESLGDDELVHVYRNVQILPDGSMASPMAAYNVETGEIRRLSPGRWNGPEERSIILTPEQEEKLAALNKDGNIINDKGKQVDNFQISSELRFIKPKTGDAKLQFNLVRNGKGLWADYNPYDHAIKVMLNDQFKAAWKRPNLVVVEAVMPKSEIEGGYMAPYAALPTGEHKWNNGRSLYLSRWSKIVRIVPFAEVAADIDRYWRENPSAYKGAKVTDYDRFQPQVREELEKLGYRFEDKGKRGELSEAELQKAYKSENATYITSEDIERMNAAMQGTWHETPATELALAPKPKNREEAERLVMADRVEDLSEKLNTPIRIITNETELQAVSEDGKPRYSRRERRAKGWWSSRTDEVVVVLPNNVNVADVENTVVHEVVGHKGLRAFIGEERFDEFLDEVYGHASGSIRKRIDALTDRMMNDEISRLHEKKLKRREELGESRDSHFYEDLSDAKIEAEGRREQIRREATEEYMADLGGRIGDEGFEKMSRDELTLWGKIKAKVQRFLDKFLRGLKIAKSIRLSDKDLSYILFKSWKNARERGTSVRQGHKEGGIFAEVEDVVRMQGTRFSDGDRRKEREQIRKESVADRIEELFNRAVSGDLKGKPIEIGKLTEAGRKYLEKLSGKEMKEIISFVVNPSDLVHIYRRHFGKNEKDGRNIPLTKEDIRNMHEILCNPERIIYGVEKDNLQRGMFFFLKGAEDGSYNLMEVYSDRKGNLTSKSFFKNKEGVSQRAMLLNESSTLTSVTDGATLSDGAKLPKFFEYPKSEGEEDKIFFRDPDMGLEEAITKMKADAAAANGADFKAKQDAMRAIGGNLSKLRQAMARQREYDITTVKSMTDLGKILLDAGLLDDLSKYETKRILSAIKDAVGREDTSKQVQRLMDIMVDNQLRMGANYFGKLLSVKGSRVDARGIEVQGELDPDGQKILLR